MVSKRNQYYHQQWLAKQRPHYGLRKLSVGLASVLLGTTLYWGGTTALADSTKPVTPTENSNDVEQVQGQLDPLQQSSTKEVKLTNNQTPTQNTNSSTGGGEAASPKQSAPAQLTPIQQVPVAVTPHANSGESNQDWSLTVDHDTLSWDQPTLSLTWKISNFKNGDVYTLNIPKGDLYSNDGVGVAPLPNGIGTSKTVQNADGSYTITDTFTSNATTGGMSQGITLTVESNSNVIENGRNAKRLTITKNGKKIGDYSIYEDIEPTMSISQFKRTNPKPEDQKQILVNQDYSYSADITVPFRDAVYHYGKVDLTLNVPKNFQINIAKTMDMGNFMNNDKDDGYNKVESITQDSAGAPVIFKGLQLGNRQDLTIVGRFVMASPSEDEPLMAQPSTAVWTLNGGKQIQVAVPAWGDTILGNETQLPDGNIFKGGVTNAYPTKAGADYSYQDTVPLTSPVDIGTSSYEGVSYINQLTVNNPSAYNFHNIHYTATFSDGYSVDQLSFSGGDDPSWPVEFRGHKLILGGHIQVIYQDGSSEVVRGNNGRYQINPNKNLAKVEWIDDLDSGKSAYLDVSGKVAKAKQNGQLMQVGDKLTASINLASDPAHPEFTVTSPVGWSNTQTVVQKVTVPWSFGLSNSQDKFEAGTTSAGHYYVNIPQNNDYADLVNPHIYYVLPTTIDFSLDRLKGQFYFTNAQNRDQIIPFKVSTYQVNGRTVIEYDGSGLTIPGYANIQNYFNWYNLRNDLPNMSSDGYAFISADNLQVKNQSDNPLANADQMAMLKNAQANHTFQIGKFTVAVRSATGMGIAENAQGNTDSSLTLNGHSDDKGSTQMTFSTGVIYNPEKDGSLHNIVVVTNLPKDNTDTSFNFNLNQNGATAVNAITGEALPTGSYELLYSTQPGKVSNEKTDLSSYVTGDQVSDWSQIKSVALRINELSKQNGAIRLVLQGEEPTVTADAGKISYLSSQAWSDEVSPMEIVAPKTGSSSIKIDGQSTVKARLHYKDAQGQDQYIKLDDLTHQYKDNQDTMKRTDFNLSKDDQKLIPAGYHLSLTPTIINGAKTWQTNAENGKAAFGQVVKYYFDGDIVQYELTNQAAAQLQYYDDTTKQFISGVTPTDATGNVNAKISFTPTTLKNLTDRYDYVGISKDNEKNPVDPTAFAKYQFGNYDSDDNTTQTFVVHLKHGVEPVDDQHPYPVDPQNPSKGNVVTSKTVNRTITYQFSDGSSHPVEIPTNPVEQSVTFTGTGHVDKVTGKLVDVDGQGNITKTYDNPNEGIHWTAPGKTTDDGTLDQQKSPVVAGYTPDKSTVKEVTVHHDSKDIATVVTYTPDQQDAQLTFYDDTTGQVIPGKQDSSTGNTSKPINFNQGSNLLKSLTDQGYEFVKVVNNTDSQKPQDLTATQYNQVTFPNFDNNDQVTQKFVVHLKHGTKAVSDAKTVNETIHYKYKDGTTAKADHKATPITFNGSGVMDLVTKNTQWKWTPDNDQFKVVKSPAIQGYTADKPQIDAITVKPGDEDIEQTVTYSPDSQKIIVNYIDDTTGKTLKTVTKTGPSDSKAGYNTKTDIAGYQKLHYNLVSDSTNGANLVFDHDDDTDQVYNVHLTHQTKPTSRTKEVNETVHYVYTDGSKAAKDYHATPLKFIQTGTTDLVTNQTDWDGQWSNSQVFAKVDSPEITGYTPSQKVVKAVKVSHDSPDIDQTITYTANEQVASIKYIDDTTDQVIKTNDANGKFGGKIEFNPAPASQIQQYEDQGYQLVSTNFNGQTYQADNSKNEFEVHLTHRTENVERSHKVTRTINYLDRETNQPVDQAVTQTVEITQHGVKDLVTGNVTWVPATNETLKKVDSPIIDGYGLPSQKTVNEKQVTFATPDTTVNVYYTKHVTPVGPSTPSEHPGQPISPAQPSRPTNSENGDQPSSAQGSQPEVGLTNNSLNDSEIKTSAEDQSITKTDQKANELPQTGNENHNTAAYAGLALFGLTSVLALLKKKHL